MTIFAVDPGPEKSALVVYNGVQILLHQHSDNDSVLKRLRGVHAEPLSVLVIEKIASFGMPVGADVFTTCEWSGRFIEAWASGVNALPWAQLKRHEVKAALCHSQKAKDANIRQALIDRFGPGKEKAIGNKRQPGPLYGIAGDEWSALAVAVTWWERHTQKGTGTHG